MKYSTISLVPNGIGEDLGCAAAGMALGALAWALCPILGGPIQPLDNIAGFLAGQVVMTIGAFWIGWATGSWGKVAFVVSGLYLGQVLYSVVATGPGWIPPDMVPIIALCVFPAVGGLLSLGIGKADRRRAGHIL